MKCIRLLLAAALLAGLPVLLLPATGKPLKTVTINAWSGSDYRGTFAFGLYESAEQRGQRYRLLLQGLKDADPDVIFVQEANPARSFARRLAKDLGMSQVHQVCISGLKAFGLGVPANFSEGNAILARPALQLAKLDDWKLSGSPGLYSDCFSFHLDETVSALLARILIDDKPVNLLCVHLSATPEDTDALRDSLETLRYQGAITQQEYTDIRRTWQKGIHRRDKETKLLLKRIKQLPKDVPLVVGGDFNATPQSRLIRDFISQGGFTQLSYAESAPEAVTWDAAFNSNTYYSQYPQDARGNALEAWPAFRAKADGLDRRLDYVLARYAGSSADTLASRVILKSPDWGLNASDHYGVEATLDRNKLLAGTQPLFSPIFPEEKSRFSGGLFGMYDTDTGFGGGAKAYFFNFLHSNEALDLTLFASTKGERWCRAVFSVPDRELRQGRQYPVTADVLIDYDKWIKSNYFGTGSYTYWGDREYYTKIPLELSMACSWPFSRFVAGRMGLKYRSVTWKKFEPGGWLDDYYVRDSSHRDFYTLPIGLRYDSRDSFNNPSRGLLAQGEMDAGYEGSNLFAKYSLNLQSYNVLCYPRTVLALRFLLQSLDFENHRPPLQALLPVGGGTTLRGSPQDRYLGRTAAVANAELRFPIYKWLGGIAAWDFGKVWNTPRLLDLKEWPNNPTLGLRLNLQDFIVRLDAGFGMHATGLYFNFGQAF